MLRVLSFNISGHNRSALSPATFQLSDKYGSIVSLVKQHNPHLLALQEVTEFGDHASELLMDLSEEGYTLAASTESHCGLTQVYAQSRLRPTGGKSVGPIALCRIPLPLPPDDDEEGSADMSSAAAGAAPDAAAAAGAAGQPLAAAGASTGPTCFYFAGCHLEPFAEGADMRLQEITYLLRTLPPRCHLVLTGDTNMRAAENASVETLGLQDAFRQVGSPSDANFTWDSRANLYYGHNNPRRYTARYDRIYLRGFGATQLQIVANEEVHPGRRDHLSDHFGLLASVRLGDTTDAPVHSPPAAAATGGGAGPAAKRARTTPR